MPKFMDAVAEARARLKQNIDKACPHLSEEQRAALLEEQWAEIMKPADPFARVRARRQRENSPGVESARGTAGTGRIKRRDFSGEEL